MRKTVHEEGCVKIAFLQILLSRGNNQDKKNYLINKIVFKATWPSITITSICYSEITGISSYSWVSGIT